jgi:hypothetical protein
VTTEHLVECVDYDGRPCVVDVGVLLRRAWATEELRAARAESGNARMRCPRLRIHRRVPKHTLRRERGWSHPRHPEARARDYMSGHAKVGDRWIVLTIDPRCGREWIDAIVVHEAAHMALGWHDNHGPRWRTAYLRACREIYGDLVASVRNEGANSDLDEVVSAAIRSTTSCEPVIEPL